MSNLFQSPETANLHMKIDTAVKRNSMPLSQKCYLHFYDKSNYNLIGINAWYAAKSVFQ